MSSMNITSDEVNFLIYKYLQESGFHHSAFTFFNESCVVKSELVQQNEDIPHGSLISVLQKGLQYIEVETHLQEDGTELNCSEPFSLVTTHVCQVKKKVGGGTNTPSSSSSSVPIQQSNKTDKSKEKETNTKDKDKKQKEKEKDKDKDVKMKDTKETPIKTEKKVESTIEIPDSLVTTLTGHSNEVFICSWNPAGNRLASGSGDSTARIWTVPSEGLVSASKGNIQSTVLNHFNEMEKNHSIDVTTLDWNYDGSLLATGSYDGLARVWSSKGDLIYVLQQHQAPIFSLKWNKKGDYLLSGSVDKTSIVWDIKDGSMLQQFDFHTAPTLDIDWRNNTQFASCSTDKMIYLCEVGKNKPIKTFKGHDHEINAIKWDPTGNLLASCSDDGTAKIWSVKSEECVHDLKKHKKEIYTIKWSPTGPGTANPNKNLVLASASFDSTVKIWDVENGNCIHNLTRHKEPVYTLAFSPNGEYIASGSFDKFLYISSVKDGTIVKSYRGSGGIFDLCWDSTGEKLAASFSNATVSVIDMKL